MIDNGYRKTAYGTLFYYVELEYVGLSECLKNITLGESPFDKFIKYYKYEYLKYLSIIIAYKYE